MFTANMALSILVSTALVLVLAESVAAQEVEPAPTPDERPATIRVCVTSFDTETGIEGPDDVVSVDVRPTVADARIGVAGGDGCALLENVRPGTYNITLRTARGFTVTDDLTIPAGDSGTTTLRITEPRPGQLPTTGYGDSGGSSNLAAIVVSLSGAAFVAGGSLALVTTRRRRA